jgi:Spy/CpxP family protein refolding chaperone
MKTPLLIAALSLCLTAPLWAQSDDSPPPPPPDGEHHGHGGPGLTKDEWTELKSAHDAALQANPDLATQEKALHQQMKDLQQKIHDAMVKADPKVEPILAKLEAGHHHGPPPPDAGGQ